MNGWRRRGYSIAAMRELARARAAAAGLRLRRRRCRGRADAAPQRGGFRRHRRSCRSPLNGATSATFRSSSSAHALSLPVMIGPTGLAGLFWPDGEAARRAPRPRPAPPTASATARSARSRISPQRGAAPRWMQVFIYKDRGFTRELAERAAAAGYDALVLTIDNQFLGNRERDIRNGFTIPPRFGAADIAAHGAQGALAVAHAEGARRITFGNYVRPGEATDIKTLAGRMASLLDPAMSWADVDELRRIWSGPLILKGMLHPDEAKAAVDHGVDGHHRLQPWRPPARRGAGRARRAAGDRRGGRAGAFRSCSTAASGAAPTSSRPSRSAPPPASSAGRSSGAWRSPARPASPMCSTSTAARSTGAMGLCGITPPRRDRAGHPLPPPAG